MAGLLAIEAFPLLPRTTTTRRPRYLLVHIHQWLDHRVEDLQGIR